MDKIQALYEKLRCRYAPLTEKLMDNLFSGEKADQPQAMFPPEDGKSFDYQQAEAGFLMHDCATLTAFRATRTVEENREMNVQLIGDMIEMGLDFIPVDGCFREVHEAEASHEDSFFVYDKKGEHDSLKFFRQVFILSEKYGQDSFLFKSAGMNRTAFLISTNPDSREQDGDIKLAGKLYFNLPPVGPYTTLDKGRFTFVPEPEPEPEVMKPQPVKPPIEKRPSKTRVNRKRFIRPEAKDITLSQDGDVKIGRYTIGTWSKTGSTYQAELNNKRSASEQLMSALRSAIATACKRGITGKYKG